MDHKTIVFDVNERNISSDDAGEWISFNDDYIAMFRFDSEWDNKIKTAEFIQGNDKYERVLENDKCEVPPLKSGLVRVGVYTSKMTSTPVLIGIRRSIKDFSGVPAEPPEDVYAQLTALVESGILKGDNGLTPYVGENNNWWIGDVDTDILARGYTPVKGTDYFTESEIQQIQNEVSSGAIGDFKTVVDEETASFNTNAQEKLATYNQNDSEKTEAYNSNAQTKLADYNANADNRVAEFDARTEQIQTDISGLKSDLTGLQTVVDSKADKSDLAKTNLYLDALFKLNKGQTWDTIESESEAYSVDVPSGSHYASVDMVGGKSIVWNQLIDTSAPYAKGGKLSVNENIFTLTPIENTVNMWEIGFISKVFTRKSNHKYYMSVDVKSDAWATSGNAGFVTYDGLWCSNVMTRLDTSNTDWQTLKGVINSSSDATGGGSFLFRKYYEETKAPVSIRNFVCCDLTRMFGAGNEPSTVEEFEAMFPADSEPTIISSQTDRVDVASADGTITQQITTNFPVLNSAGSVYDYIDLNEGKLHQKVGKYTFTGNETWARFDNKNVYVCNIIPNVKKVPNNNTIPNIIADKIEVKTFNTFYNDTDGVNTGFSISSLGVACIGKGTYDNISTLTGSTIYYELAEPVITDIEIPTELTDWLTVEAGGSITFHNADEGKRLLIPNKLSFVRKLDEVTV